MRRRPVAVILVGVIATFGCGGDDASPGRPFEDGQSISQATSPETSSTQASVNALPGYETITQFLAVLLPQNDNLRNSVTSATALAECMLKNGYQLNGIPTSAEQGQVSNTSIPIESLLGPMLVYLVEICSELPASSWSQ